MQSSIDCGFAQWLQDNTSGCCITKAAKQLSNDFCCMQVSFLGHSAPGASSKVQRGGSGEHTNGCRSFIFGNREDSNTEVVPVQQPAEVCDYDPGV
jgi:hypothetical protein